MRILDRIKIFLFGYPVVYTDTERMDKLEERVRRLESYRPRVEPNQELSEKVTQFFPPIPGYRSLASRRREYEEKSKAAALELKKLEEKKA